ncbi:MAG TPA: nitroreductase/quinone reductase family protein [Dehalococcoidia bacterium]|nr:nitroreductase/quinone reductase family protein [Dehalococcoidia bacterium]
MPGLIGRLLDKTIVFLYRISGGILEGQVGNLPILLLTTIDRTTGEKRTVPEAFMPYGDDMVVIAVNPWKGASLLKPGNYLPEWWFDLGANSQAEVQVGRKVIAVVAEEAAGYERQQLWQRIVELSPGYDDYRKVTTDREIPVVLLRPVS